MLTDSQKATIISLQDYLTRISCNIVRTHWPQADPADILAEMNLAIAEKAEADPAFLEQSPGYVTKAAAWHARHWCRATFTRDHNGERVGAGIPLETDDKDERPADELYAAPEPDNDLAIDVRAALVGLDKMSLRVATLKMAGWRRCDIAEELNTSSQALSIYLKRIEAVLAPVWAAMTGQPEPAQQLAFSL